MRKSILLSLLSAILLILSFPKFDLWGFSWFGFVPLFFAMENKKPLQRFLLSYFTGIIFFFGTLYWLYHVSILGLILLVLYLAIYFGLFGLIFSKTYILHTTYSLLFIPSLWVLLEYLRNHLFTGFSWVLLGYSQYLNLPIIQISDITGIWGLSFLVMMVNVEIWQRVWKSKIKSILTTSGIILFVLGYGFFRLNQKIEEKNLKVSIIQGNIPQEIKWEEAAKDSILDRYLDLTKKAAEDSPGLIIWPEASYPETISFKEDLSNLINLAKEINVPILLGVVRKDRDSYFNSAILIKSEKEIFRYDKLHLVPFGEYIPLKSLFKFLETIYSIGDFSSGREYTVFKILNPKMSTEDRRMVGRLESEILRKSSIPNPKIQKSFSVLICFEDIFPEISRRFVNRGADFLVVITNDAWFGRTSAPYQHLQASVFRAVENRRYLVRSANTGVSCFITPKGEIFSKVSHKRDIFVSGYKTEDIILNSQKTLYTKFGDYFILFCLIISVYGIIRPRITQ